MRRWVADSGFFLLWRPGLSGNPDIAAKFALADDANRSNATPEFDSNPSPAESICAGGAAGPRRLVKSTTATAGTGEASILHVVAIKRSDSRLAGLMLRREQQGIEAVVVVVEPFPPHARPQITLPTPCQESQFIEPIVPAGAGIRFQGDGPSLVTGPWRTPRERQIKGADGGAPIDGVAALSGVPKALQSLNAECGQK